MQEQGNKFVTISGVEIDMTQDPMQRIISYLEKVDNPTILKVDDYEIQFEWRDTQVTLQECITKALFRICSK